MVIADAEVLHAMQSAIIVEDSDREGFLLLAPAHLRMPGK